MRTVRDFYSHDPLHFPSPSDVHVEDLGDFLPQPAVRLNSHLCVESGHAILQTQVPLNPSSPFLSLPPSVLRLAQLGHTSESELSSSPSNPHGAWTQVCATTTPALVVTQPQILIQSFPPPPTSTGGQHRPGRTSPCVFGAFHTNAEGRMAAVGTARPRRRRG